MTRRAKYNADNRAALAVTPPERWNTYCAARVCSEIAHALPLARPPVTCLLRIGGADHSGAKLQTTAPGLAAIVPHGALVAYVLRPREDKQSIPASDVTIRVVTSSTDALERVSALRAEWRALFGRELLLLESEATA